MINIKDKIITLIKYFKTNNDIQAVWIIGSYETEYQSEESDIDFSILFNRGVSILEEMKVSCNISDIIGYSNVDTVDLRKAPLTLQFKTIKEGRSLYEADHIKTCDYIEFVINRYREEKYYMESFRKNYYKSYVLKVVENMNFDKEKLDQKILFMQTNVSKLKKLSKIEKGVFIEDFRNVDSTKYLLQVTIEAMIDISSHLISRNRWGKPESDKTTFQILADNNIIKVEDVDTYFLLAKLKNRIMRMYFNIVDEMIHDITQNNLEDFDKFISDIVTVIQ